ncbi:MAG: hypothetical protein N2558_03500 [Patescibacteria group bacterium]|nr:hypothetical protein [Patescibacteria group bacterium]
MRLSKILGKENVAAFSYVLGPVSAIVLLLLEKDRFIRFHCVQSIFVVGFLLILNLVFGFAYIFASIIPLLSVFTFLVWLILIYKAWQGDEFVFPVLGRLAKKIASK